MTHTHTWGPIQQGRLTGEPSRPCTDDGCNVISLDLYLYCVECGQEVITDDSPGVYHHANPDSPTGIDHDADEHHAPVPETGEAPYDEDD